MSTPKVQPLLMPVLRAIADGNEHDVGGIRERVADYLRLSIDEREEVYPRSGQNVYVNLVAFALANFKRGKAVTKKRNGWYQITERGARLLDKGGSELTIEDVRNA